MRNNIYGTVKPANFNPSTDVDVYYNYKPNRSAIDISYKGFKKIDNVSQVLEQVKIDGSKTQLPGMYTLKLPVSIFSRVGIYTIYITPKEYECEIKDIGVLSAYPEIKGIVIDINAAKSNDSNIDVSFFTNDNLIGYSVEYIQDNESGEREDYFRIITTNTKCSPITQNLTTSSSISNGYRYNESDSLCFITVSPSTSPNFKTNAKPYIGVPNQKIRIKNTKFDPVCVEVEITEHDIETVSYMLEGEQVRNLENGTVSIYNFDGEIYKQMEYFTVKDNYNNSSIAEVKVDRGDNIDNSLNLNTIKGI